MNKKKKKGSFSDILGILIFVLVLIIMVYFIELWMGYGRNEVQGILSNYEVTILDRDIATTTNVFEKTALFFGLQKTATHLGKHGGVPIDIMAEKENIEPDLNYYNDIYSWTFIKDCNIETRIPFTTYNTTNIPLGNTEITLENPNNVELKTVLINIWMFKDNTVKINCTGTGCTIDGDTTKITKSGTYAYTITNTDKITLKAEDGTALLKLIGASPYKGTDNHEIFINSMNQKLTEIMQETQNKAILPKSIIDDDITAIYGRNDTYATGFAKFEDGIVGEVTNPKLPKVTLQSFGETDEILQARYWKLYDLAQEFTLNAPAVLNYRLWNVLDNLDDYQAAWNGRRCGTKPSMGNGCPVNNIQYFHNTIFDKIVNDIAEYELEYNTNNLIEPDITVTFDVPPNLYDGCDINMNKAKKESCNKENFEYYEYTGSKTKNTRSCMLPDTCGRCRTYNTCESLWAHRYMLKKLRINAIFTDQKYNITTENGKWIPLTFSMIIELPLIENNCCKGYLCNTLRINSDYSITGTPCDTTNNANGNPFNKPAKYAEETPVTDTDAEEPTITEAPATITKNGNIYDNMGLVNCNLNDMDDATKSQDFGPGILNSDKYTCMTLNDNYINMSAYCYKTPDIEKTTYTLDCNTLNKKCDETTNGKCE